MKDYATQGNTNTLNTQSQGGNSFSQIADTDTRGGNSFNRKKVWNKTGKENLVRHKSGRYYARVSAKGKEVWKSLATSHLSVAQARLAEFLKAHRQRVGNGGGGKDSLISAKMTFGKAAKKAI